ncbi:MAG: ubiquinol-cytochrome C chaperone family protein [Caulobacterales bacterium]
MFLERMLRPGPVKRAAERLYAATVARARSPALYADLGAPDTPDGRFEVYTLFVLLVLERLRSERAKAAALSQAFFDAYLSGLDNGLRELAVGDLSVGKTMRKLGEAFYGRAKALNAALASLPDRTALEALIDRTVFAGEGAARAARLADRLLEARDILAAAPLDRLLEGELSWDVATPA